MNLFYFSLFIICQSKFTARTIRGDFTTENFSQLDFPSVILNTDSGLASNTENQTQADISKAREIDKKSSRGKKVKPFQGKYNRVLLFYSLEYFIALDHRKVFINWVVLHLKTVIK